MAVRAVPEGYSTATPYLIVSGASDAIEFYKKAFGASEVMRFAAPNGKDRPRRDPDWQLPHYARRRAPGHGLSQPAVNWWIVHRHHAVRRGVGPGVQAGHRRWRQGEGGPRTGQNPADREHVAAGRLTRSAFLHEWPPAFVPLLPLLLTVESTRYYTLDR